eukprot:2574295-Prymnesium_polylepis.1
MASGNERDSGEEGSSPPPTPPRPRVGHVEVTWRSRGGHVPPPTAACGAAAAPSAPAGGARGVGQLAIGAGRWQREVGEQVASERIPVASARRVRGVAG